MIDILTAFGLNQNDYSIGTIGNGHIHQTYLLKGSPSYILQRVNNKVFTKPEIIAQNLRIASDYLKAHYPDYLFLSPILSLDNREMVDDLEGYPWRLYPYFENTITLNEVSSETEAYQAAKGFARLTNYLKDLDVNLLKPSIEKFHDLNWRYLQFQMALEKASPENKKLAETTIQTATSFSFLLDRYNELINLNSIQIRITHNDTKINNILFDEKTKDAFCVIDLDTLMPGYFIYDLGDLVRTVVSPVGEEEKDFSKISFRKPLYDALVTGYLSEIELTEKEKQAIPFAGLMMTYIMALRFLADFLNNNIYYHITYPEQNLVRAGNQLKLLTILQREIG